MEDVKDIHSEYETLFGKSKRVNLFDTEEECNTLLLYAKHQPTYLYRKDKLPFDHIDGAEFDISIIHFDNIGISDGNCERNNILSSIIASLENKATYLPHAKPISASTAPHNYANTNLSSSPIFYLQRDNSKEGQFCNAHGRYDSMTNGFTLLKGSRLALDMSLTFSFSPAGINRVNFLQKYCKKQSKCWLVVCDARCDSPSSAASIVLGRIASGRNVWVTSNNQSINDLFPKKPRS